MAPTGAPLRIILKNTITASIYSHLSNLSCRRSLLLALTGGLLFFGTTAYASPNSTVYQTLQPRSEASFTASTTSEGEVHFYGSAPEPGVLGASYLVFTAADTAIMGAIFMPQSSFDCFQGHIQSGHLALEITNSYSQEVYPYEIARVAEEVPVATIGEGTVAVGLEGFFELGEAGASELELLSICQNSFAQDTIEL